MEQTNKLFCFGLDNAGKTTLLNCMQGKEVCENPTPTRAFDVIDMVIEDIEFIIWDAPGQVRYRKTWEKGLIKTDILLFLIDTADKIRYQESNLELNAILRKHDVQNVPLVICFHKFDLKEAQNNLNDAIEAFHLSLIRKRELYWLKTSVYQNDTVENLKFILYNLLVIKEAKNNLIEFQDLSNI
ncbi:MAG: ADP-ribosylation factor-like protein [Promethearchaeota archaeon]